MSSDAHVVRSEGIARFESPAAEDVIVRATGEETGGHYDLLELTIPPGPAVTPLHIHRKNDEAMYVLEGELTVRLGEERHVLPAGAFANAPRGMPHTYANSGDRPARVLFTLVPGNHWEYLEAAAEHGPVEDDADMERVIPILESYGVEIVGPPLAIEDGNP